MRPSGGLEVAEIFRPKKVTHVSISFHDIDAGEPELLSTQALAAICDLDGDGASGGVAHKNRLLHPDIVHQAHRQSGWRLVEYGFSPVHSPGMGLSVLVEDAGYGEIIGMAFLRLFRGSVLEENFARTVGSIGESVAAGAIFTIPAFVILKLPGWQFGTDNFWKQYLLSSALMILGGLLGIMFVTVLSTVFLISPDWAAIGKTIFHPALPKGGIAWLLGVLGGIGGTVTLLSYSYWVREKNRSGRGIAVETAGLLQPITGKVGRSLRPQVRLISKLTKRRLRKPHSEIFRQSPIGGE
jgi:hypothetical protein